MGKDIRVVSMDAEAIAVIKKNKTLFRETYHSVTSRFFSNNTCWNERLITPSGLVFVGQILGKSSFVKKINRAPHLYWYALSGKTPV